MLVYRNATILNLYCIPNRNNSWFMLVIMEAVVRSFVCSKVFTVAVDKWFEFVITDAVDMCFMFVIMIVVDRWFVCWG